jgi:hypothetical protein
MHPLIFLPVEKTKRQRRKRLNEIVYSGPQKWDNGLRCVSQKKEAQIGQEKT